MRVQQRSSEAWPVNPLEPANTRIRCQFSDWLAVWQIPKLIIGYAEPLDSVRMRESLAHLMCDFPSLAGRFATEKQELYIEHGFGSVLEVAESTETSESLFESVRHGHSRLLCQQLSMLGCMSGKSPIFAARITQTPTGSVLGVTWNHALCDLPSMVQMLRAWAKAYRGEAYAKPLEVDDRGAYLEEHIPRSPSTHERWRILSWPDFFRSLKSRAPRDARRVFIDFSWNQVEAIHEAACRLRAVSPGDALCAHILWRLCALSDDVSPFLWMPMNYRKLFRLPVGLVGNYADIVTVTPEAGDGTAEIAAQLRLSKDAFDASMLTWREFLRIKASRTPRLDMMRAWPFGEPGRLNVGLADTLRSGHDRVVFQTARPKFAYVRLGDSLIPGLGALGASPSGSGITLEIALPARIAERVRRDADFATAERARAAC